MIDAGLLKRGTHSQDRLVARAGVDLHYGLCVRLYRVSKHRRLRG